VGVDEWFKRAPLLEQVADAGGWDELLRRRLGQGINLLWCPDPRLEEAHSDQAHRQSPE
jgi:hypothetical protein